MALPLYQSGKAIPSKSRFAFEGSKTFDLPRIRAIGPVNGYFQSLAVRI